MDGFSNALRNYRKRSGKTQEEIAKEVGMSRTGYADLEKAGSGKVFEKLPIIAKVLGCRIDDLFPEMAAERDGKTVCADGFEGQTMEGWAE